MKKHRIVFFLGLAVVIALVLGPACATKKYVQTETASVDQKVQAVQSTVEENQKRIKEHDEKLATLGTLITQNQAEIKSVDGKIEDVRKSIQGTLVDKAVLTNDQAKFKFDSAELGPEAKAAVDQFVQKLVADNRGVYIEIRGYTDNVGPDDYNLNLSKRRATAVMEYFYKQYHIPLYRMQVIGMGNADPVADNKTKEGRSQNRRVEILVYE
jgi:outer membrane protein OmpA-like peptidoglycan-associated protein